MDTSTLCSNILDDFVFNCDGQMSTAQYFHIENHSANNTLDWGKSYKDDNDTFRIIFLLRKDKA